MRIDGTKVKQVSEKQPVGTGRAGRGEKTEGTKAAESASVVADTTQALVEAAERGSAARVAYVDELKFQVQQGKYFIDLDRLAAKMADDELARGPKR